MKKYKILLGGLISATLLFSGCQDIDLLPKDNLPDELYWKTPEDFMKEANWLYSRTESFDTKDTDSDIGYEMSENTTSNGTLIAPNSDTDWSDRFEDLRHCNIIIEKAALYEGDQAEIERYVAEARFFRAYTHWRLMKKFNDVPILTKVLDVESSELYGSRNTQEEVENFILSELDAVWQSLPLQSELTSEEKGRVRYMKVPGMKVIVICLSMLAMILRKVFWIAAIMKIFAIMGQPILFIGVGEVRRRRNWQICTDAKVPVYRLRMLIPNLKVMRQLKVNMKIGIRV